MEIIKAHKKKIISLILFSGLALSIIINYSLSLKSSDVFANEECVCEETQLPSEFYVDIKGAVKHPGVYLVNENNIIKDIIDLAGGLKSNATTSNLNLAEKVTSAMVITVNTKSELTTLKPSTTTTTNNKTECTTRIISDCGNTEENSKLVNINTASKEELMSVPNIGASKADSIIIYRSENSFKKIEDIMNVSGIGETLFVKIKDHITV